MKNILITCFALCCFSWVPVLAQNASRNQLKNTIALIDSAHEQLPAEQLYLQLDKPYYALGDTLRFKAYLLDEALSGSLKSGLLYVELINDSSRVIKRQTIMVKNSTAHGDMIIKNTLYPGNYTLRAYTNWIRNFGTDHFFTRQISIASAGKQYRMVSSRSTIDKNKNIDLQIRLSDVTHKNIGLRDMQLSVMQGTNTLLKNTARTGPQGDMYLKFNLSAGLGTGKLSVLAEEINKEGDTHKIVIPLQLNRPDSIDLQFMPEGGNLIAGISTRIGFKTIGEDGAGVEISGKIVNSKQQQITTFKTCYKGMGSFELKPVAGESYTAKFSLTDDSVRSYTLPAVNPSGIALRVDEQGNDTLLVSLNTTPGLATAGNSYYLIGQAREKVCYGAGIVFKDNIIRKKIPKNVFPTGIVKWVLLDAGNRPLTQRMSFIDHNDRLRINVLSSKDDYLPRDSVAMILAITDAQGIPTKGNFSMAVTDDSQVKPFDEDDENITSRMLLNADLKGYIEKPGYYFNEKHKDRTTALDNLMLTQGWVNYDWKQVFNEPVKPKYEAEPEFMVKGRVSNVFNKGIDSTEITLKSMRMPPISVSTFTDKKGGFSFRNFPPLDTIQFYLETKREKNIGVAVDEFIPPAFTPLKFTPLPWYMNRDTALVNYVGKKQVEQDEAFDAGKSKLLKQVDIKANKGPFDPFATPWLNLNEEEIRNARPDEKPLHLMQLLNLKEQISQMIKMVIVDGNPLKVYMDIPFYDPKAMVQTNEWLNNFNSEDIKALRITQRRGKKPHISQYDPTLKLEGIEFVYLVVQITTNSGNGEQASLQGGYVFRPMPVSWPHQFYSPRYPVNAPAPAKDNRSTIYWAPDIPVNASGKMRGWFYTADTPGTYTIIIEGTDLNGNVGYHRQQIRVGSKAMSAQ